MYGLLAGAAWIVAGTECSLRDVLGQKHRSRCLFVRAVHLICLVPCWQELAEEHEGELRAEEAKKPPTKGPAQVRITCTFFSCACDFSCLSHLHVYMHVVMLVDTYLDRKNTLAGFVLCVTFTRESDVIDDLIIVHAFDTFVHKNYIR